MKSTHTVDKFDVNPEPEIDLEIREEPAVFVLDADNDADTAIMESSVVARASLLNDVDKISWFHGFSWGWVFSILTRSSA